MKDKAPKREITLPRRDYQPPKEKQEEEFDMPDADARDGADQGFFPAIQSPGDRPRP